MSSKVLGCRKCGGSCVGGGCRQDSGRHCVSDGPWAQKGCREFRSDIHRVWPSQDNDERAVMNDSDERTIEEQRRTHLKWDEINKYVPVVALPHV